MDAAVVSSQLHPGHILHHTVSFRFTYTSPCRWWAWWAWLLVVLPAVETAALLSQATRAVAISARQPQQEEGPQRGSSAALEALLSSPRSAGALPLLADPGSQAPWDSDILRTNGGSQEAAPFVSGTAAGTLPRLHQRQAPPVMSESAGAHHSQNSITPGDAWITAPSGGGVDGVVSVPDTPLSPFKVAQRELSGGALLGSSSALRSAYMGLIVPLEPRLDRLSLPLSVTMYWHRERRQGLELSRCSCMRPGEGFADGWLH